MILGLRFDGDVPAGANASTSSVSDSFSEFLKGFYPFLRLGIRYHRSIGVAPEEEGPGVKTINETLDSSVFERWRSDPTYRPPGVLSWAKVKGVDPAQITSAVRADDPAVSVAD